MPPLAFKLSYRTTTSRNEWRWGNWVHGICGHYERGTAHAARLLPSLHAEVVKIKFTWNNVDLYLLCDSHSQGAAGTTLGGQLITHAYSPQSPVPSPSWCRLQRRKKHKTTLILSLNEFCTTMDLPADLSSESSISMMSTIRSKAKGNAFPTPRTR